MMTKMAARLLPLVVMVCSLSKTWAEVVDVRIVEGSTIQRYGFYGRNDPLKLRTAPANLTGPPHLMQFNGTCIQQKIKDYKYQVCPLQNVTQKEESNKWDRFHGVLGSVADSMVFREWIIENDTFMGMYFAMGESCGDIDREAKVFFVCSQWTKLSNVSEPERCHYTILLHTPLACFKGAMKVHHVLPDDALEQLDSIDLMYHDGLLTEKGVDVRKRRVFQHAGLLYTPPPPTMIMVDDKAADQGRGQAEGTAQTETSSEQERASVREELQTAKRVLSQVKEILQSDNCTLQDIRVLLNTYPLNVTL